jgi:hypothetical protein
VPEDSPSRTPALSLQLLYTNVNSCPRPWGAGKMQNRLHAKVATLLMHTRSCFRANARQRVTVGSSSLSMMTCHTHTVCVDSASVSLSYTPRPESRRRCPKSVQLLCTHTLLWPKSRALCRLAFTSLAQCTFTFQHDLYVRTICCHFCIPLPTSQVMNSARGGTGRPGRTFSVSEFVITK